MSAALTRSCVKTEEITPFMHVRVLMMTSLYISETPVISCFLSSFDIQGKERSMLPLGEMGPPT